MEESTQWLQLDEAGGCIVIGRQRFVGSLIGGLLVLILSGCGPSAEEQAELHYRLKVEVETPQGLRSGSSVIKVMGARNPNWVNPEGRGSRGQYRGEAVAVDLPYGRTLFALLQAEGGSADAAEWPIMAYADILNPKADFVDNLKQLSQISRAQVMKVLPKTVHIIPNGGSEVSALPMLVTFKDISDPKSVQRVDPDDLSASFGAGVKLKAITVEITDDTVTSGIGERLAWWHNYADKQFDGHRYNDSTEFANSLNRLHFSRGIKYDR